MPNLVDNNKYWSIDTSDETQCYEPDSIRRPWQGVLKIEQRPGGPTHILTRYINDTPCSRATEGELFETEKEAWMAYLNGKIAERCFLYKKIDEITEEIRFVANKMEQETTHEN